MPIHVSGSRMVPWRRSLEGGGKSKRFSGDRPHRTCSSVVRLPPAKYTVLVPSVRNFRVCNLVSSESPPARAAKTPNHPLEPRGRRDGDEQTANWRPEVHDDPTYYFRTPYMKELCIEQVPSCPPTRVTSRHLHPFLKSMHAVRSKLDGAAKRGYPFALQ
jgi:hypothetical protein